MNKRIDEASQIVYYLEVLPGTQEENGAKLYLRAEVWFTFITSGARMQPLQNQLKACCQFWLLERVWLEKYSCRLPVFIPPMSYE